MPLRRDGGTAHSGAAAPPSDTGDGSSVLADRRNRHRVFYAQIWEIRFSRGTISAESTVPSLFTSA